MGAKTISLELCLLFCIFFICLSFSEHTLPLPTSTHGQFLVLSVPLQTPPYLSLYDHVNGLYWSFQGCGMSSGSLAHGWPHIQNDNNSVLQQKRFSYVNISCHSAHQWETQQEHRDNDGNSVVGGSMIWQYSCNRIYWLKHKLISRSDLMYNGGTF